MGQTGALADTEYQRIFQEAQLRRELGDDSLLRQLLGMPENAPAAAYDPWGYGNGNETLGGGGGGGNTQYTYADAARAAANGQYAEANAILNSPNYTGNAAADSNRLSDALYNFM